jgi:hypothetical protein
LKGYGSLFDEVLVDFHPAWPVGIVPHPNHSLVFVPRFDAAAVVLSGHLDRNFFCYGIRMHSAVFAIGATYLCPEPESYRLHPLTAGFAKLAGALIFEFPAVFAAIFVATALAHAGIGPTLPTTHGTSYKLKVLSHIR